MMMKLTVTLLASLAAVEAAHGRRHVRRDDYGYQPYPVPAKSSSTAPFPLSTGVPSSVASSSSSVPPSFILDLSSTSTGTSVLPSTTPEGITFSGTASGSVSASSSVSTSESSVVEKGSSVILSTGGTGVPYPTGSGSIVPPFGTGTTVPPPVGTAASSGPGYGEYVTTTTIYSTQIQTVVITKDGGVTTSLHTTVQAIPSKCTKTSGVPDTTAPASEPVSKVVHVSTQTLTYTVGVGSTAHAVTTEIVQTSTETIYKTIVITLPYTGKHGATTTAGAEGPEGTTVISQTSTTTKFITVYPTPGTGAEGSVAPPVPTGGDAPVCAPPQTVTVTEKETVTVTAGKEEVPVTTQPPVAVSSDFPTVILTSTAAPSSAPYPFGNSTVIPTIGSTGFVTFTKPTGIFGTGGSTVISSTATVGTDIPETTKGTEASTDLPSFVFPTKGAVSTGSPAEVPSSTSTAVKSAVKSSSGPEGYPQPTPSKGGNYYGYRMRA